MSKDFVMSTALPQASHAEFPPVLALFRFSRAVSIG